MVDKWEKLLPALFGPKIKFGDQTFFLPITGWGKDGEGWEGGGGRTSQSQPLGKLFDMFSTQFIRQLSFLIWNL